MRKTIKRENGTGSVYKRSDLKNRPWIAVTPYNNVGVRVVLGHFKTALEAKKALDQYLEAPTEKINLTFKQCYDEWYEINSPRKTKSWINCYSVAIKKAKSIYDIKLRELRTVDYQRIIDSCSYMSSSALNNIRITFSAVNKYGMENDIIQKDYSKFVRLPQKEKKQKEAFSTDELELIRKAAAAGSEMSQMILIMCYTGFRISEFLGLTPFQCDIVKWTLTGGMKTKAGKNRTVPVHPAIRGYVKKFYEQGNIKLFSQSKPDDFRKEFQAELVRIGCRALTPHSTRHTTATLLSNAGVAPQDIIKILGHAKFDLTADVYIHPDVEHLADAIAKI